MILHRSEEYRPFFNSSNVNAVQYPVSILSSSVPEATLKAGLHDMSPEEIPILTEDAETKDREPQSCIFQTSEVVKAFRDLKELISFWSTR